MPATMRSGDQTNNGFVLVGPDSRVKQRRFASKLARRPETLDRERIVSQLKETRGYTLANLSALRERFLQHASSRQEHLTVHSSTDAADAVDYINGVMGTKRVLAINQAGVLRELRPRLESDGYTLINTYLAQFARRDQSEKVLEHYTQLPDTPTDVAFQSFIPQNPLPAQGQKDYTALLGVSAAASEDGSIWFLQHTANIETMLREARRLIVLVGIDKIVATRAQALLQTKAMGAFGLRSVVLDLKLPDRAEEAVDLAVIPPGDYPVDIHIIVLDNGRQELAGDTDFAMLLTCISCRACAEGCPTHNYFSPDGGSYPKAYLWAHLVGIGKSLELCTGCGMCMQQCPLDIDIPHMVSIARERGQTGRYRSMSARVLQDAWLFMRGAQLLAPLVNGLLKNKSARYLIEKSIGFQRDAWVPRAHRNTLLQSVRTRDREQRTS
jgi:L-lactate dehydrogenase complex protein LldG